MRSKEETYRLLALARGGDQEARERLTEENTGLVKAIALRFCGTDCGHELEDLMQIGFIGLLKAIDRFDASFDVMFSTYAVPMILGEIKRYLRDDGRIKVSRTMKQDIYRIRRFQETFSAENGRTPRLSETAKALGLTAERIMEAAFAEDSLAGMNSIDDPEHAEAPICDYRQREEQQIDTIYLKTMIGRLSEKERKIVIFRYFCDMTQQKTASRMGISQVQVSRLEKRILLRLREEAR